MQKIEKEKNNLRKKLSEIIYINETWNTLYDVCHLLGLSTMENSSNLGKEKYITKVIQENSDDTIIKASEQILIKYPGKREQLDNSTLQHIQDSLWWIERKGIQLFSNVTRIRIAEVLEGTSFWGRISMEDFFYSFLPSFHEYSISVTEKDGVLYENLDNLLFANLFADAKPLKISPEKMSTVEFLQKIGLTDWPDKRFILFIERIIHPEIQQISRINYFREKFDMLLKNDNFGLFQEETQGGLPVYKVRKIDTGVSGTPKYIIFASSGPKPDIVISDAVNMEIRIVRNANYCLVYDQPPTNGNLTWQMLLEWWGKREGLDPSNKKVRQDFGKRLSESLQSEPEHVFFNTYFLVYKEKFGDKLPALLPQVYLHYDPRSQTERGKPVLFRQRMDFLMLLKNATRVIVEIDGKQHYANGNDMASPEKYAEMVSEDRRIKLKGYEVYRFGGAEFLDIEKAKGVIIAFFDELFFRYEIF